MPSRNYDDSALRAAREDREIKLARDMATVMGELSDVSRRITAVEADLSEMVKMASRWKGATVVLLGLGSFSGWLVALWSKAKGLF